MKIALINLPVDNNYGGNLQRYALTKVLQDMGHEVTHFNLRFHFNMKWYKAPFVYFKRIVKKCLIDAATPINREKHLRSVYKSRCVVTESFYQKYIKHTEPIYNLRNLKLYKGYDVYLVGSDQVWRKKIAKDYLPAMFLNFIQNDNQVKRIAYGISFGVDENELNNKEIKIYSRLYKLFDAVSVRESSSLMLLSSYGWIIPEAIQVLDPTLLLSASDYNLLIENSHTQPIDGSLFCYILDKNDVIEKLILQKSEELALQPFEVGIADAQNISIEQWLRSFRDAKYVITDSYHGLVFSIIFRKPYYLIRNSRRGCARFDSLLSLLNLDTVVSQDSYNGVNSKIEKMKEISLKFLYSNLEIEE